MAEQKFYVREGSGALYRLTPQGFWRWQGGWVDAPESAYRELGEGLPSFDEVSSAEARKIMDGNQ